MRAIFIGPAGLRSGWRVLAFTVLAMALHGGLQALIVFGLHYTPTEGFSPSDLTVSDGVGIVGVLLVMLLFSRLERRSFADYGLPRPRRGGIDIAAGLVWGFAAVALTVGLIAAAGGLEMHGLALHGADLRRSALLWSITMIVLGVFEELLFRGYTLATLARGAGFWPAAVLLSTFFGAIHYFGKPMENVADALSVGLIGLFLCLTIARTGSIWWAIGFHAAFDFAALVLFAAPNTGNRGLPLPGHLLDVRYTGAEWLTGGPRGIEASLMIFPVLAVMFAIFVKLYRPRATGNR
jgi:membrane protease YdiL (CAAX protease family)